MTFCIIENKDGKARKRKVREKSSEHESIQHH